MKTKYLIILCSLFVIFSISSCKKWLDVSSNTEIVSEQQFSDVTGFRDAVVGVYVKMAKPDMYAMEMTWRTVEFLSQQYAVVSGAPDLNVPKYLWTTSPLPAKRESIWLATYSTIANINQVLKYQAKNRSVFAQYPITDSLIRGEMLGLRAFLHLDLMRLYGKGNLGNRPELQNALAIPYVTDFSRVPTSQRSYKETMALMKQDIEEAIRYLECDPLSRLRGTNVNYWAQEAANGFISTSSSGTANPNRKMRMNYWAAKALYARILMWEGTSESKAQALKVALEVIGQPSGNGIGIGPGAYYSWVTSSGINGPFWYSSDLSFVNEHLFTLQVEKFLAIQETSSYNYNWFYSGSPNNQYSVVFLSTARRNTVFEAGTSLIDVDWRATKGLFADGSGLTNWTIAKFYNKLETPATYSKRMPLIRISEMYYIAAECFLEPGANYDKSKALAALNKVRNQRNIPASLDLSASLSDVKIREEITKEYMKEFIAEGQLFYYYKRQGARFIPGFAEEMTDVQYQMPMPDSEVANGGVRVN
uniref:RagB/SusD family nutrient uptake outer membrane protein n=1 Tax=Pedobacter schmidteae TaxID=2201271 RepID=UPI000EB3E53A|nr:RagB/SusD family nutrient uptake outer membrane protein [Pedobacter schmidteae]